jgi:seryl-tRNA synthetase
MHDLKWIREHPEDFDKGLARRGLEPASVAILKLDEERRANTTALQEMQARRNAASKEIGNAKGKGGDPAKAEALMAEVAALKDKIAAGEERERKLDEELRNFLAGIPNIPAADVPDGKNEHDNIEVRKWGKPRNFNFEPKQHFEIGEVLGMMDFEAAAKISGARFTVLKGPLARLDRALGQFMLDVQTQAVTKNSDSKEIGGYTEVNPPLLVKDEAIYGTAQLPKFAEDLFRASAPKAEPIIRACKKVFKDFEIDISLNFKNKYLEINQVQQYAYHFINNYNTWQPIASLLQGDYRWLIEKVFFDFYFAIPLLLERAQLVDAKKIASTCSNFLLGYTWEPIARFSQVDHRWLIPTSEVPLTNLVRESILAEADLPHRFTALTPCFRAEAGAAGKDTRGMIRQHQFYKVELVSITTPEQSEAEHQRMTGCAEEILKRLELSYRTMILSSGDTGFAARKTYDIEVWLPGQNTYREISSCSNCGDFQARRMQARYRPKEGKDIHFVHTLNGSGLAVGRALIAVIENYQQKDGSIRVPEALRPYMGGIERIGS